MISEILTPLDGTKVAEAGMSWAADAGTRLNSTVRLLHVIDEDGASDSQVHSAEAYLEEQKSLLESAGVMAVTELVAGRPAEAIIERANRVNLTVMTSGTVRWLVSAVLDQVLQEVVTPVVIVRAQNRNGRLSDDAAAEGPKIIVPLDSSNYSADVLPTVRELAHGLGASIVLLHVVPPVGQYTSRDQAPPGVARILDQLTAESAALTQRAAYALEGGSTRVEMMTEIGEPDRCIIRAAERSGSTLIAMATRGRDRLDRRVSGSVANAVMESTSIPCLFVRPVREHVPA